MNLLTVSGNHLAKGESTMNRTVRIFGKAVPLWLIAVFVFAGVALGAWLFLADGVSNITSAPGINLVWYSTATCTLDANPEGYATIAIGGASPPECNVGQAHPGVIYTVGQTLENLGGNPVCAGIPDESGLPAWAQLNSYVAESPIPASGFGAVSYTIELLDTMPSGGAVNSFTVSIPYSEGACP